RIWPLHHGIDLASPFAHRRTADEGGHKLHAARAERNDHAVTRDDGAGIPGGCQKSHRRISPMPKARFKAERVASVKNKQTRIETSGVKSQEFGTYARKIRNAMADRSLRYFVDVTSGTEKAFAHAVVASMPLDRKQPSLRIRKARYLFLREGAQ